MSMSLILAVGAAVVVGAFAKRFRNRSFVFWFLGTTAAMMIGEIPLRLMMAIGGAGGEDPLAKTIVVTGLVGGLALAVAAATRRRVTPSPPAGG